MRPFKSDCVIEEKISEATLRAYHVGFEENKFRLQPLVDVLSDVIPEFAFGYHEGSSIPTTQIREKLKEAAKAVYTTEKYKGRGEFGELILHLLLRDFCNTTPLIAKIHFKDSRNKTVAGFDGVHIEVNGDIKKLWLGQSKIYSCGRDGVLDLANDIKKCLQKDYLREEFALISKKIPQEIPEREHWIKLMNEHNTLQNVFQSICIPCACTYSSDLFKTHTEATGKFLQDFKTECYKLKEEFEKAKIVTNVEVILLLLPVHSKDELVQRLNEKLKRMRDI